MATLKLEGTREEIISQMKEWMGEGGIDKDAVRWRWLKGKMEGLGSDALVDPVNILECAETVFTQSSVTHKTVQTFRRADNSRFAKFILFNV
jgi:hypothetical protein